MQLYSEESIGGSSFQGYLVCVPRKSSEDPAQNNPDLEVLLDMHGFEGGNNIISSNIADEFRENGVEVIIYLRLTGLDRDPGILPDCKSALENLLRRGIDYRSGRRRLLFHHGETRYICELRDGQQINTEVRGTIVNNREWKSDKLRVYLEKRITKYIAMRREQMEAYDSPQRTDEEKTAIGETPIKDLEYSQEHSQAG